MNVLCAWDLLCMMAVNKKHVFYSWFMGGVFWDENYDNISGQYNCTWLSTACETIIKKFDTGGITVQSGRLHWDITNIEWFVT